MIPLCYLAHILFLVNHSFQYNPSNPTSMPEKRNLSAFDALASSNQQLTSIMSSHVPNKLRRLPHVFSKVLELPFGSDADVFVQERHDCFKFTVKVDESHSVVRGGVKAHLVQAHPGITKVVVRPGDDPSTPMVDDLELDVWRYRLPSYARAELATALYLEGELVVVVPKNGWGERNRRAGGDCKGGFKGGNTGNLVLVY